MDSAVKTASYPKLSAVFPEYLLGQACTIEASTFRLLSLWFPDGAKCASCGERITGNRALNSFWKGHRTYCSACESQFSPFSGTILDGSKLTPSQFEIILLGYALKVDQKTIAALVGVLPETVENWFSKIRFWESRAA